MAWNEPGGGNRDPWGGKGSGEGPPDLDEMARKLRDRMNSILGGGGKRAGGKKPFNLGFILVAVVAAWVLSGIYIVEPAERGVVLRFGKYHGLAGPGIFWIIPIVDTTPTWIDHRVMVTPFSAEKTLTKDTVPVDVDAVLFWVVWDAEKAALEVELRRVVFGKV